MNGLVRRRFGIRYSTGLLALTIVHPGELVDCVQSGEWWFRKCRWWVRTASR